MYRLTSCEQTLAENMVKSKSTEGSHVKAIMFVNIQKYLLNKVDIKAVAKVLLVRAILKHQTVIMLI